MVLCNDAGQLVATQHTQAALLEVRARYLGTDLFMLGIEAAKEGMRAVKATMQTAMDQPSKDKLEYLAQHALESSKRLPGSRGVPVKEAFSSPSDGTQASCLSTIAFDHLYSALRAVASKGQEKAKAEAQRLSSQLHELLRQIYEVVAGVQLDVDDEQLEAELQQVALCRQRRSGPAAHPLDPRQDTFLDQLTVVEAAVAMKHPIFEPILHMVQLGAAELR